MTLPSYPDWRTCFEDRHNHRDLWHDLIHIYGEPEHDPARFARFMFSKGYQVYCGLRNPKVIDALRDHSSRNNVAPPPVVWVDASKRLPPEPKSSNKVDAYSADLILPNNGTLEDFVAHCRALATHLSKDSKIIITGHARHGKDTLKDILQGEGFSTCPSSEFAAEHIVFPVLMTGKVSDEFHAFVNSEADQGLTLQSQPADRLQEPTLQSQSAESALDRLQEPKFQPFMGSAFETVCLLAGWITLALIGVLLGAMIYLNHVLPPIPKEEARTLITPMNDFHVGQDLRFPIDQQPDKPEITEELRNVESK